MPETLLTLREASKILALDDLRNARVSYYAIVAGQRFNLSLHGENVDAMPSAPVEGRPLPPVNNVYPARIHGHNLELLVGNKVVKAS